MEGKGREGKGGGAGRKNGGGRGGRGEGNGRRGGGREATKEPYFFIFYLGWSGGRVVVYHYCFHVVMCILMQIRRDKCTCLCIYTYTYIHS